MSWKTGSIEDNMIFGEYVLQVYKHGCLLLVTLDEEMVTHVYYIGPYHNLVEL